MDKLIIVIEDNKDILDLVSSTLRKEGFDVLGVDHPGSLEKVIDAEPALILLDNRLGDGFGNTLCFSLKSNPLTKHIPIVLVSACSSIELIARSCQADSFLPKPFDLDDVVRIVNRFTRHARELI